MADTQSLDSLLTEGAKALAAGDRQKAVLNFYSATRLDPKSVQAWLGLAKATDNRDDAINALGQAIALDPGNIEARNLRIQFQVGGLRESVPGALGTYRENPIIRFGRPILAILVIALLGAAIWYVKDPVIEWWKTTTTVAAVVPATPTEALLPATWTPVPTERPTFTPIPSDTPIPSPTPDTVKGRINGPVSARSGPGPAFPAVAKLNEPTAVELIAISSDGTYYLVTADTGGNPVWVSTTFVTVTSGDVKILKVVDVPTPTPTRVVPTKPPPPPAPPVVRVVTATPQPPPPPAIIYYNSRNSGFSRCDRTYLHGTIWINYRQQSFNTGVSGQVIRVWFNGDGSRDVITGSQAVYNTSNGYWELGLPQGQAASGSVAVVNASGQLLSNQVPFAIGGGSCSSANVYNEIIIDFSATP